MAERTQKFYFEMSPSFITAQSLRGINDSAMSSDCRCGMECSMCPLNIFCDRVPWMALGSAKAWGEEYLTPDGVPDGDVANPNGPYIPIEDMVACDMFGEVMYSDPYDQEEEQYHISMREIDKSDPNQWPISALI